MDEEYLQWNFKGQTCEIQLSVKDTVQVLKDRITEQLGIPGPKQKLKVLDGPHLNKDEFTMAKYNIKSDSSIELGVKERGGRKK